MTLTPEERAEIVVESLRSNPAAGIEDLPALLAGTIRAAVEAERQRCRALALAWAGRLDVLRWSGREVAEYIARDIEAGG